MQHALTNFPTTGHICLIIKVSELYDDYQVRSIYADQHEGKAQIGGNDAPDLVL